MLRDTFTSVIVCPQSCARTSKHTRRSVGASLLGAWILFAPFAASQAQVRLGLDLLPTAVAGSTGETVTFTGRITNQTGVALSSADMFFNFDGFDPDALSEFAQVLGNTSFVLPNNTFSQIVPLFTVSIGATAQTGLYTFDVRLQDVNDIISAPVTGTVDVRADSTVIPEPSTLALLGIGLALSLTRLRRQYRADRSGRPRREEEMQ